MFRLQKRIYRAQACGNAKTVHSLQRLLMKSEAARMLAVRRVTQDNQGKKTAGIDGIKAVGPAVRLLFVHRLRTPEAITAQPVRRVYIPKPGKPHESRPLGIPVLLDRAHQALGNSCSNPNGRLVSNRIVMASAPDAAVRMLSKPFLNTSYSAQIRARR